jgi:hypothetical protein
VAAERWHRVDAPRANTAREFRAACRAQCRRELADHGVCAIALRPVVGERADRRVRERIAGGIRVERLVVAEAVANSEAIALWHLVVNATEDRFGIVGGIEGFLEAFEEVVRLGVVRNWRDACEREDDVAGVLLSLHLTGNEIEESILRNRSPDRSAPLLLRRRRSLAEGIALGPVLVAVDVEERSLRAVRAALRNGVHDAASRPAELRGVTRRDDLEFLDCLLRDREGIVRAFAASDAAEERLVVVSTVDADVRVDATLPGKRNLAATGVNLRRRRQRDEVLKSTSVDWQVSDRFLVNGVRAHRGARLDEWRCGFDGDDFLHASHGHGGVERNSCANRRTHPLLPECRKPG